MSSPAPTLAPSFHCAYLQALPFDGAEVLVIAAIFLAIALTFCVTFFDVAVKQLWPDTFLNKLVAAQVAGLQSKFPNIGETDDNQEQDEESAPILGDGETKKESESVATTPPTYTAVVAQQPYVASRTVDEDLLYMLANKTAFSSVSGYCSSTVRGYAMLSMVLPACGLCLSFMWMHNAAVNPSANDSVGRCALLGYMAIMLTGTIMCTPNNSCVQRIANICLFFNIPLKLSGKYNPVLKLHGLGVTSFVVVPMISHAYTAFSLGPAAYPNFWGAMIGCAIQLLFALLYIGMINSGNTIVPRVMRYKLSILLEICCVFSAFLAFAQFETYAASYCANWVTGFHTLLVGVALAPCALIVKNVCWAPNGYPASPSVLLVNGKQPVATYGSIPTMAFNGDASPLPTVK